MNTILLTALRIAITNMREACASETVEEFRHNTKIALKHTCATLPKQLQDDLLSPTKSLDEVLTNFKASPEFFKGEGI